MSDELKVTRKRVREAMASCPTAKSVLAKLFPEVDQEDEIREKTLNRQGAIYTVGDSVLISLGPVTPELRALWQARNSSGMALSSSATKVSLCLASGQLRWGSGSDYLSPRRRNLLDSQSVVDAINKHANPVTS